MPRKISLQCPSCQVHITASVRLIGHTRKCPGCGVAFVIPDPVEQDEDTPVAVCAPQLISQRDTVDMRLEWEEIESGRASPSEKIEAEGARVANLVVQYYRIVGRPDSRAES